MFKPKSKTASNSKITKNSHLTTDAKYINTHRKKIRLVQSELRLRGDNIKSTIGQNNNTKGKTAQFLQNRKESILNSNYNVRKSKLMTITKQNRKIYERINSQKSNYSSRALNKSYDSVCSHSSRISNKSSRSKSHNNMQKLSRNTSIKNSRLQYQVSKPSCTQPLLKAQNINTLQKQQILNFNKVFIKSSPHPPKQLPKKFAHDENKMNQIIEEQGQNILYNIKKSLFTQYTPDRGHKNTEKNHKTSTLLPQIKETTPQRKGNLQRVIQSLGYRYRY